MQDSERPFHAIVVGGGPVGLTLAHTLGQAGIEFTILEGRQDLFVDEGASLILYPMTLRVYAQLGILDAVQKVSLPLHKTKVVTWDGKLCRNGSTGTSIEEAHGAAPGIFHRRDLVRVLHQTLDEKSQKRVLQGKKVVDIESNDKGVTVHCLDGTTYEGSVVIGADGVHSKTRGLMRNLALKAAESDPTVKINPEQPYTSHYRCMWGNYPTPADSPYVGQNHECHGTRYSSMLIIGRERSWFFLYGQLDAPTQARRDYTEADMEEFAATLADMHLSVGVPFRDVWPRRLGAGMSNLPEGVCPHWSFGRVVLAGDAAFKVTPNFGWGYNSGVQSAVVLTNALREVLYGGEKEMEKQKPLTTQQLDTAFAQYGARRRGELEFTLALSAHVTRQSAWPASGGGLYRFAEQIMNWAPGLENLMVWHVASRIHRAGHLLDFVRSGEEPCRGAVAWTHPYPSGEGKVST